MEYVKSHQSTTTMERDKTFEEAIEFIKSFYEMDEHDLKDECQTIEMQVWAGQILEKIDKAN